MVQGLGSQINCCHGESSCQSKLQETLHRYFGFSSFRPGQSEAAIAVLQGCDVFVRMATGSGKSLCCPKPQYTVHVQEWRPVLLHHSCLLKLAA